MVPHLITAYNGPLLDIEQKMLDNTPLIERWFRLEWQEHTPPFYCSVDLRNAGFKLAPVDTNLFPGGFNNLSSEMLPMAIQATMTVIEKVCPDAKNILLIPEKHTRNTFYLKNIAVLCNILRLSGLNVRLGTLDETITQAQDIALDNGQILTIEPIKRIGYEGRRIGLEGFDPCSILLNNDLSAGIPEILQNVNEQTMLPPIHAGWAVRKKSNHFAAYDTVARKFSRLIDIDHWMINPYFKVSKDIDFSAKGDHDDLQEQVNLILKKIKKKYKEYGIQDKPYVVVKANAGTYGMGIMMIEDPRQLVDLNRKARNKMSIIKEGLEVNEVLIQEGVHTIERLNNAVAEPVVYMIDRYVVGSFYRTHSNKDINENLNSPGMEFTPMPHSAAPMLHIPDMNSKIQLENINRFYMYGVIGRLALLASSIELEKTDPEYIIKDTDSTDEEDEE